MAEKIYFDSSVATPTNVKKDYLFKDATTRDPLIGTMAINPSQSIKINPKCDKYGDNSYTIPEGYHDGTSKVYVGNLSEYTPATAAPDGVAYGKVFWANGERLVGTLNVESLAQEGTATAGDIVAEKTAWVNGKKITGTIPYLARRDKTLLAGESYTLPYGLSPGSTVISAASLSSQTQGDATSEDIVSEKVAWVNGEKITGTLNILEKIKELLSETDATPNQVLNGKKFYSSKYDTISTGTMQDHSGEDTVTIDIGSRYLIPEGYYNGQSAITTKSLSEATISDAKPSNLLTNKTAWVNGEKITGTMAYNTESSIELDAGQTYQIPIGYHTGNGKVTSKSIAKQTQGTAEASNITADKTAWVNGVKLTGTMPDNTPSSKEVLPGEVYYIPEGYHHGTGTVWAKSIKDATQGTATAENILLDKTAWVNGEKITGTMPSNEAKITTLLAGDNYIIAEGYHSGSGKVKAASLASQTEATSSASDIKADKTAWVNGEKITGTLSLTGTAKKANVMEGFTFYNTDTDEKITGTLKLLGDVTEEDVVYGKSFYSTDPQRTQVGTLLLSGTALEDNVLAGSTFYNTNPKYKVTGTMPNIGQVAEEVSANQTYTIPKGYHDGTGTVRGTGLSPQTEGTADETDIILGKTAWVNGNKLTGTLKLNGNATPEQVLYGYTYYSTDPKNISVGQMPVIAAQVHSVKADETYNITKGYHDGNGMIVGESLESQTEGTAAATDILSGKTAWVNGVKLTGTIVSQTVTKVRISAGNTVVLPAGYYPESITIYSLYSGEVLDLTGTDAYIIDTVLYPNSAGYVEGSELIIVAT